MTNKHKIITISDHPLGCSGVGVQARLLYGGLVATGKYSIRSLGAAIRHDKYDTIVVNNNPDFVIKPIDGFGDQNLLRQLIVAERPDAVLLFTDPRFFEQLWPIEHEIRSVCPIAYWHLWDSPMAPHFNRYVYDSVDLVNCINWHTYDFVKKWAPEKTHYVPHAIPPDLYFPLQPAEAVSVKAKLFGAERVDHFMVLYVSRNARRKMTPDVIASFKMFLDELEQKHGHRKASLVLHTEPIDPEGTNLFEVVNVFDLQQNVIFSKEHVDFNVMNALYNSCDVLVSRSTAEGFGLTVLEAKMAGKPVVALKTGGVSRQVQNHETGEEYGVALEPDVVTVTGNLMCPYITDDYVSNTKVAAGFMKMYEAGPEKRAQIGARSREHALRHYNINDMIGVWDRTLETMIRDWKAKKTGPRWTVKEL